MYNKFFFFEHNQEKLNYCKNYGLLIYDYDGNNGEKRTNIGDYIQSLAAAQYLPKYCKPYLIDRDKIQYYNGPKVKLIMNGYYRIKEGNIFVSKHIIPLFISYNVANNNNQIPLPYIDNIKNYSPIGCRDIKTKDKLMKYGINTYFSSCLTTTLDIYYSKNENERTNDIYFIDYKLGKFPQADKYILSLKKYNLSNIIYTKHHFNIKLSHIKRFKLAKALLNKYSKAKLVVTTRIHGALPCLAFNTPVILINKKYDYQRFPGLFVYKEF